MKSIQIKLLLFIGTLLFSCATKDPFLILYIHKTPNFIIKDTEISYQDRMESTPIVFHSKVYDIISNRVSSVHTIDIYDTESKIKISSTDLGIGLASALVYNNELYVMGSTNWQTKSPLKIYKSSDLQIFTEVGSLVTVDRNRIFNSSMSHDNNNFIIAVEEDTDENSKFHSVFYESNNLTEWKRVSTLTFTSYIACPTLRYLDGMYYVFYLLHDARANIFYTSIARSADYINWEPSNKVVIAPSNQSEGQNTSDFDLVEHNNEVIINYAIGNQESIRPKWADIKKAIYKGSMENFVKEYFK